MLGSIIRSLIDAGAGYRVSTEDLLDATVPDIGDTRAKASAFWILLVCSSAIAAAGVLTNSTAVVIGAMVIAPLGTPIYGIAASIVAGRNVLPALLRMLLGCAVAIAIGFAVDLVVLERVAATANPQILSRTSPSLVDLGVAFFTGLAGSMALVRSDISPALPGVAIAISLVPPLTVVGICISGGEWGLAGGALVLFTTNMLAIILSGLIVFTGAGIGAAVGERQARSRRSIASITIGSLVVVALLVAGSVQAVSDVREERRVQQAAEAWAAQSDDWKLTSVARSGDDVVVRFLGRGDTPDLGSTPAGRRLANLTDADLAIVIEFDQGGEIQL